MALVHTQRDNVQPLGRDAEQTLDIASGVLGVRDHGCHSRRCVRGERCISAQS